MLGVAAALLALGGLLYWLLVVSEGTYLGSQVVALLYDWYAGRYDRTKGFDPDYEQLFLLRPMLAAVRGRRCPVALDIATGTGRVPLLLLQAQEFSGYVAGLDYARRMLAVAADKLAGHEGRFELLWQNAMQLPFPDDSFDLVSCLEALEFMPDPGHVLNEAIRVAQPGSTVFLTRRRGWERRLMPGKCWSRPAFHQLLVERGLEGVQVVPWQKDYDLAWGRKSGAIPAASTPTNPLAGKWLAHLLRCPQCGRDGTVSAAPAASALRCASCHWCYPKASDGPIELARPVRC